MKKNLLILSLVYMIVFSVFAQEEQAPEKDRPVRAPFESGLLIDNQTTVISGVKTLEFDIQHKFGTIDNGFSDLFGLYAPGANIRMALNYVPVKNLQVGYGLSRINMYNDFSVKYTILEQTRKNTIPVAVAVFANMAIDGRSDDAFGDNYQFSDRMSYFSQLIIGRKFSEAISLQANVSFTHYNKVEPEYDHDKISAGLNGRVKISPQSSILVQYDIPMKIKSISEHTHFDNAAEHNMGIGWEIRTRTHFFQIYMGSADGLIPQHNAMYNTNDWTNGDLMFGFTIARLWSF